MNLVELSSDEMMAVDGGNAFTDFCSGVWDGFTDWFMAV